MSLKSQGMVNFTYCIKLKNNLTKTSKQNKILHTKIEINEKI